VISRPGAVNEALPHLFRLASFTDDSAHRLRCNSKLPRIIAIEQRLGKGSTPGARAKKKGSAVMARFEILDVESGALGEVNPGVDMFFELGMMYSTGRSVPADLVSAHKWFNIAATRGNSEATRLRREIAIEMSEGEIAAAQRAARDWLGRH
jgi:hypothetical protein